LCAKNKDRSRTAAKMRPPANGLNETARRKLLLPSALLVTIQAQLFTTFMFVDLGLAAFFD
jgi:hypothetical protein